MPATVSNRAVRNDHSANLDASIEWELIASVSEGDSAFGRNPHAELFAALAPTLESLGTLRVLDRPESRLAFAAHRAERRGKRPIHLAFGLPHEVYMTPAVPTALVPLWGFADIPDRDLGGDGRQNWARIVARLDAVLPTSTSVARAFGVDGASILPVPVDRRFHALPDADPSATVAIACRHLVAGEPSPIPTAAPQAAPPTAHPAEPAVPSPKFGLRSARRFAIGTAKRGYNRYVRRWLSQEAHERLKGFKRALLRRTAPAPVGLPAEPIPTPPPTLPVRALNLSGLVFVAEVDFHAPGVNDLDLITAFLIAFRSRPDATLAIALRTDDAHEAADLARLMHHYETMKLPHQCRVVAVVAASEDDRLELVRTASFVVDTRRFAAEPGLTTRGLAAGRPVVAPTHTAFSDWIEGEAGFPVRSSGEPEAWPHDPEGTRASVAHRLDWADLRNRLTEAGSLDRSQYRVKSAAARAFACDRLADDVVRKAWGDALAQIAARPSSTLGWGD